MTRATDALTEALGTLGWFDTGYTEATDLQNATAITAALPPDIAIVSVAEVAERLHASDSELACIHARVHGTKCFADHQGRARRLLGLDEP